MGAENIEAPRQTVSHGDALTARRMVLVSYVRRQDVDDITQEVLCGLAFHREPIAVPEGRTPAQARVAFLWRVAVWKVTEHQRRQSRLRVGDRLGADVFWPLPTPSAEELVLAFAPLGALRRALATLHATRPELHAMLDLIAEGATFLAAAAVLAIPPGTACTRLRRARALLRMLFHQEVRGGAARRSRRPSPRYTRSTPRRARAPPRRWRCAPRRRSACAPRM